MFPNMTNCSFFLIFFFLCSSYIFFQIYGTLIFAFCRSLFYLCVRVCIWPQLFFPFVCFSPVLFVNITNILAFSMGYPLLYLLVAVLANCFLWYAACAFITVQYYCNTSKTLVLHLSLDTWTTVCIIVRVRLCVPVFFLPLACVYPGLLAAHTLRKHSSLMVTEPGCWCVGRRRHQRQIAASKGWEPLVRRMPRAACLCFVRSLHFTGIFRGISRRRKRGGDGAGGGNHVVIYDIVVWFVFS